MTASAIPQHWLDVVDEQETRELEAMIGAELGAPATFAQIDALASEFLRHLLIEQKEIARLKEAEAAERARIQMRYEALLAPKIKRISMIDAAIEELVKRAGLDHADAKKKSRVVGNGVYGSRRQAATAAIVDAAAALEEIKQHAPELVKTKTEEWVGVTEVKAYEKLTGALPKGTVEVPEKISYYGKAE